LTERLLVSYGDRTGEIVAICEADPANAGPLASSPKYLRAEIVQAITSEGALHLDDVLSRRTHIAFELPERGVSAAEEVTSIMAPLLGWDEATIDHELSEYSALAAGEKAAMELHDDRDALRFFTAQLSQAREAGESQDHAQRGRRTFERVAR
jgi:glycerol-3-phosphate dehydrogenase